MPVSSAAHRDRVETVAPRPDSDNRAINLRLVTSVPKLLSRSEVASRLDSIWRVGRHGNVDTVSNTTVIPHALTIKASMAAGAIAVPIFALLETITSWGDKLIGALTTVIAASFAYLAVLAKNRFDERQRARETQQSAHSTDVTSLLAREKLADERITALFIQQEKIHTEQLKSLESQVSLTKELYEQEKRVLDQKNELVNQQRELIAQQAATIQQLKDH